MRAAIVDKPGAVRVGDVPDPQPGPDGVVVRVGATGICGTDLHIAAGEFPPTPYPIVPGHEFSGEVVAVGSDVRTGLRTGDRVAVDPSLFCGYCGPCRSGRGNLCANWGATGDTVDGAFAEYVAVPAANCYRMPEGMSWRAGALVEPLSCAVHGVRRIGAEAGESFLVVGAGTMGLLIQQLLQRAGARVTVVDRNPDRLPLAERLGAERVATDVAGLDTRFAAAVDVTGAVPAIEAAFDSLERGGRLLVFGVAPDHARIALSPFRIYNDEITVVGSMAVLNSFGNALDLLAAGAVEAEPLLSHALPLEEFPAALELMRSGAGVKVQVVPGGEDRAVRGVFLPGGRRVEFREVDDPEPGHGQVVLRMRASTICGSDLRAVYREHLGEGPEAYRGVVAGHEPCGEVVAVGPGCVSARVGDRAVVYHISGCGTCADCRRGYQINCTSPARRAYGWQRDGGHAEQLLAEERDLVPLPDELTFLDGACVACGFGTAYEALCRAGVSGRDTVLITGLGPVGLAAGLLARAMGAPLVVGTDPSPQRRELAEELTAVHGAVEEDELGVLPGGGAHVSVDCSGSGAGQLTALRHTLPWGRSVMVGEGGTLSIDVSRELIHRQITLMGSWVTSTHRMRELLENLALWRLHPEGIVTERFALDEADQAYKRADAGSGGKVAILNGGGW